MANELVSESPALTIRGSTLWNDKSKITMDPPGLPFWLNLFLAGAVGKAVIEKSIILQQNATANARVTIVRASAHPTLVEAY